MNGLLTALLSGLVVFGTHLLEGITGFGSAVLALPFLSPLIGLKNAIPVLCILSCFMASYLVWRSWRSISWKEFFFILFWVGCGVPIGLLIYEILPARHLCVLLGAAMIVIGGDGIRKRFLGERSAQPVKRSVFMRALLCCGGILQGAFGSGGPFVVIYAAKALPDKSLFRVTLSLLWLVINGLRLAVWTIQGNVWNREIGVMTLCVFPFMIAGLLIGDLLHRKVDESRFRLFVYILLAVAGAVMTIGNLRQILG